MGIADRDYVRNAPPPRSMGSAGIGQMSGWSVTTWLIALCVGVFVLDLLLLNTNLAYFRVERLVPVSETEAVFVETYLPKQQAIELDEAGQLRGLVVQSNPVVRQAIPVGPIERWGFFSADTAVFGGQVWRWVGFQFLHAGGWHLLGNMIGLYFFGSLIETYLGRRRYLAFYLLCGVAGPVIYCMFALAGILQTTSATPLIGASAGVFGILAAAAVIAPNATVLVYGILPMQLRTMALLLLGFAAFMVFTNGNNAGGEAAHLGGAALGYLFIRHPEWLKWAELGPKTRLPKPKSSGYMRYTG
ncbi:MAG: rhomboid family intramembrane serine protease [Planctomycetota bacterium]